MSKRTGPPRPKSREVLALALATADQWDDGNGGNLHIAMHDGNLEDNNIEFCRKLCVDHNDAPGLKLCEALAALAFNKRKRVYRRYWQSDEPDVAGAALAVAAKEYGKVFQKGLSPAAQREFRLDLERFYPIDGVLAAKRGAIRDALWAEAWGDGSRADAEVSAAYQVAIKRMDAPHEGGSA